jgi:hypothetical protein
MSKQLKYLTLASLLMLLISCKRSSPVIHYDHERLLSYHLVSKAVPSVSGGFKEVRHFLSFDNQKSFKDFCLYSIKDSSKLNDTITQVFNKFLYFSKGRFYQTNNTYGSRKVKENVFFKAYANNSDEYAILYCDFKCRQDCGRTTLYFFKKAHNNWLLADSSVLSIE